MKITFEKYENEHQQNNGTIKFGIDKNLPKNLNMN